MPSPSSAAPVLRPSAQAESPVRPRLRGRLHQVAAVVAVPAGIALVRAAPAGPLRTATAVYAVALVVMLAVSATYHRGRWSARPRRLLKTVDHAAIFAFTAATYTPLVVLLPPSWRTAFGIAVWGTAGTGAFVKARALDRAGGLADVLYGVLGWSGLAVLWAIEPPLTALQLVLLVGGGVLYSAGALVLVRGRPDPWPRTFGYHEVGHAVMLGGTAAHYAFYAVTYAAGGLA